NDSRTVPTAAFSTWVRNNNNFHFSPTKNHQWPVKSSHHPFISFIEMRTTSESELLAHKHLSTKPFMPAKHNTEIGF
ncbi:MAG: hypothetical protein QM674_09930, partial [Burkholderiaceae bacterium]